MKKTPMYYVMEIDLENGWTMFNCSLGSWAHHFTHPAIQCYTKEEATEIIEKTIERNKKTQPACCDRFKYVLVEL